jgi:hypothetical protein
MYASRDILCRRETLKVPRLSPIGTGAPVWRGYRRCRAEIVPGAVFGGGALRLALRRELGWQERPLVVPSSVRKRSAQSCRRAETVTSPGRRGDVTSRKGGNNPATWLKGGRKPSLFICRRSDLRLGGQAA